MSPDPALIRLVYASVATRPFSRGDILAMLDVARRKNQRLGISGILLYVEPSFFQVLEGPEDAVMTLYERIGRDDRHWKVLKLIQERIADRDFPDWSMGYATVTRADLAAIPGLNDFFNSRATLLELPPSRARGLLEAFAAGQWRARVLP